MQICAQDFFYFLKEVCEYENGKCITSKSLNIQKRRIYNERANTAMDVENRFLYSQQPEPQ